MAKQKVALVTGSNKGIGLAVVRGLCRNFEGDVILCSRDEDRGKQSVLQLESEGLKPKLRNLDIGNADSIRETRDFLVSEYGGLDILVNNAAIGYIDESESRLEKAKEVIGINFFATESVCEILFPILRPGARVVNVGSSAGMLTVIPSEGKRRTLSSDALTRTDLHEFAQQYLKDVEDGQLEERGWPFTMFPSYCISKCLLAALTWIHHRELDAHHDQDIIINCVHPGYVSTDMTKHTGVLTPDEGSQQIVKCCLIPVGGSPRGKMIWWDGRVVDWEKDVFSIVDAPRPSGNAMKVLNDK